MGFIKINGEKYYDLQKIRPYKLCIAKTNLPSDFSFRPDLNLLDQGKTEPAQKAKERLENIQRNDKKLREAYMKKIKK